MNTAALAAAQHRWDHMEPPEYDEELYSPLFDKARRAIDQAEHEYQRRRIAAGSPFISAAISALQDIPTQETP